MNDFRIKYKAAEFCRKTKLYTAEYYSVKNNLSALGISVIEYNHIYNKEDVEKLIKRLNIPDSILRSTGFSYYDKKRYLIFVHEDLSKKEKLEVLLRECGHFALNHNKTAPIAGNDTKERYEANLFAMFVAERTRADSVLFSIMRWLSIILSVLVVVLIVISTALFVKQEIKEAEYFGDYYIAAGDSFYHEKDCFSITTVPDSVRLTDKQYETGNYSPCPYCIE